MLKFCCFGVCLQHCFVVFLSTLSQRRFHFIPFRQEKNLFWHQICFWHLFWHRILAKRRRNIITIIWRWSFNIRVPAVEWFKQPNCWMNKTIKPMNKIQECAFYQWFASKPTFAWIINTIYIKNALMQRLFFLGMGYESDILLVYPYLVRCPCTRQVW